MVSPSLIDTVCCNSPKPTNHSIEGLHHQWLEIVEKIMDVVVFKQIHPKSANSDFCKI